MEYQIIIVIIHISFSYDFVAPLTDSNVTKVAYMTSFMDCLTTVNRHAKSEPESELPESARFCRVDFEVGAIFMSRSRQPE